MNGYRWVNEANSDSKEWLNSENGISCVPMSEWVFEWKPCSSEREKDGGERRREGAFEGSTPVEIWHHTGNFANACKLLDIVLAWICGMYMKKEISMRSTMPYRVLVAFWIPCTVAAIRQANGLVGVESRIRNKIQHICNYSTYLFSCPLHVFCTPLQ